MKCFSSAESKTKRQNKKSSAVGFVNDYRFIQPMSCQRKLASKCIVGHTLASFSCFWDPYWLVAIIFLSVLHYIFDIFINISILWPAKRLTCSDSLKNYRRDQKYTTPNIPDTTHTRGRKYKSLQHYSMWKVRIIIIYFL